MEKLISVVKMWSISTISNIPSQQGFTVGYLTNIDSESISMLLDPRGGPLNLRYPEYHGYRDLTVIRGNYNNYVKI